MVVTLKWEPKCLIHPCSIPWVEISCYEILTNVIIIVTIVSKNLILLTERIKERKRRKISFEKLFQAGVPLKWWWTKFHGHHDNNYVIFIRMYWYRSASRAIELHAGLIDEYMKTFILGPWHGITFILIKRYLKKNVDEFYSAALT